MTLAAGSAWAPGDLEAVGACPACGAAERIEMHAGLRDRWWDTGGPFTMWRCSACGSGYLDPRPNPATIDRAYASYYTHSAPRPAPPTAASGLARVRGAAVNGYLNARYGTRLTPASRLWPLLRLLPTTPAVLDKQMRHLDSSSPGRLLDVGCGSGQFVLDAQQLGWRAEGVEPDPGGVAAAREAGLDVHQGLIDDVQGDDRYDAITISHVIEHVHDPLALLAAAHRLLAPGGQLWLATPNVDGVGHDHFGERWLPLDPPRHLVLFTPGALAGLIGRAGFAEVERLGATPDTRWTYAATEALEAGRDPMPVVRPRSLRLRLAAEAGWIRARFGRDRADELLYAARKPA